MYIHLGQDTVILTQDIIGIFDLDNTTVSKKTRDFLNEAEKKGQVTAVSYELPKSFIISFDRNKKDTHVYLSQLSAETLKKRAEHSIREIT
ncbi:MAG: DUF370 domain-containing protein [Clostridia bacterium]|nr:DUF370 domain-containing protein [Clostridia bacterium]